MSAEPLRVDGDAGSAAKSPGGLSSDRACAGANMARIDGAESPRRRAMQFVHDLLLTHAYTHTFTLLFLAAEACLLFLIISRVRYTEIDFSTYLQQAAQWANHGERDYAAIRGDSGPCVYPAGHLYVYSWFLGIIEHARARGSPETGLLGKPDGSLPEDGLRTVQYAFAAMYLLTFWLVMDIYRMASLSYDSERFERKGNKDGQKRSYASIALASRAFPPALHLVTLLMSKRLHSIYVLRLFNDPVAMTVFYVAAWLLCKGAVLSSCIMFSVALSIKMNLLLFLPAWTVVLGRIYGSSEDVPVLLVVTVQMLAGYPFISHDARAYFRQAFDFGRAFLYEWTVNWRFVSEETFLSRGFARVLVSAHVAVLVLFAATRWTELSKKGPIRWFKEDYRLKNTDDGPNEIRGWPSARYIATTLFTANLIGITFSRSLHYQFFSWYAHQIPFLLWAANLPLVIKCVLPLLIAYGWETFPSTRASSGLLFIAHITLLLGLLTSDEGDAQLDGIRMRVAEVHAARHADETPPEKEGLPADKASQRSNGSANGHAADAPASARASARAQKAATSKRKGRAR